MDAETIRTIAWVTVFVFAIHAGSVYAIVKLLTINRAAMFERKPQHENRIVGIDR